MTAGSARFVVRMKRDKFGRRRWHWNLYALNNEVIATSELYNSLAAASAGADVVKQLAPQADIRVK